MRGLDTRVALARARILKAVDAEAGRTAESDAIYEAEIDGYNDAADNFYEPPAQFANEPRLLSAWSAGHRAYLRAYEMDQCHGCNNEFGNPCRVHG